MMVAILEMRKDVCHDGYNKSGIGSLSTEIKQLSNNHRTLDGTIKQMKSEQNEFSKTVNAQQGQLEKIQEDLDCTKQEMSDL